MTRECAACGLPIASVHRKDIPFCSPLCARAQLLIRKAQGKALVESSYDHIKCLVCNVSMISAGRHFSSIHGVASSKRSDILRELSLPQGFRLASLSFRKRACDNSCKNNSIRSCIDKARRFTKNDPRFGVQKTIRRSALQEAISKKSIVVACGEAAKKKRDRQKPVQS